ncbi:MAG: alkaline phosphatase family protein [Armatimonadetes bacterium]|nr:alkaline phosphatase family protein [Armatimonadota bacterium]
MTLRLLIIGIDGADYERTATYISEGTMPTLAELARKGAFLKLQSVIPPVTPAAWTTITTGCNPGKHGLFEFQRMEPGASGYVLADTRRVPTLFHALNRHGATVGLYNVPWTYPPDPYDGFVIGGMETVSLRPEIAHPPSAFDLLLEHAGPDYEPWPMIAPRFKLDAAKVLRYIGIRVRLTRALLNRFPVDAYMVVFNMVDFVQHAFIGVARAEATDGRVIEDPVRWTYAAVDRAVGEILNEFSDPDTVTCVVSDHGMGVADRVVNMEKLFADRGWLVPSGGQVVNAAWRSSLLLWRAVRPLLPETVRRSLRRLMRSGLSPSRADGPPPAAVDWARTSAAPFGSYGCIRVCKRGDDSEAGGEDSRCNGLVDEIRSELLSLRFPSDGEPVFEEVLRGPDIFSGPAVADGPDLVAVPTRHRYWMASGRGGISVRGLLGQPQVLGSLDPPTGVHRPSGIMFLSGPGVAPGSTGSARLVDVAPTMLHLLDLPIPDVMDGSPVTAAMDEQAAARPVTYEHSPARIRRKACDRTCDRETLEQRLRALGYL